MSSLFTARYPTLFVFMESTYISCDFGQSVALLINQEYCPGMFAMHIYGFFSAFIGFQFTTIYT